MTTSSHVPGKTERGDGKKRQPKPASMDARWLVWEGEVGEMDLMETTAHLGMQGKKLDGQVDTVDGREREPTGPIRHAPVFIYSSVMGSHYTNRQCYRQTQQSK